MKNPLKMAIVGGLAALLLLLPPRRAGTRVRVLGGAFGRGIALRMRICGPSYYGPAYYAPAYYSPPVVSSGSGLFSARFIRRPSPRPTWFIALRRLFMPRRQSFTGLRSWSPSFVSTAAIIDRTLILAITAG